MSDDQITIETARDNAERIGDLTEQLRRLGYEAIPRAQYDAYRMAAKALTPFQSGLWGAPLSWLVTGAERSGAKQTGVTVAKDFVRFQCRADEAIAALRASGIDPEEK
jgi:hypothetical protein